MLIEDLDHIVLITKDLEACMHFYVEILGFTHREYEGKHSLHFGTHKINIHTYPGEFQPAAAVTDYGTLDICFVVKDRIEDIKAELIAHDIKIIKEIGIREGAMGPMKSLYVRDPDGNLIEFASYDFDRLEKDCNHCGHEGVKDILRYRTVAKPGKEDKKQVIKEYKPKKEKRDFEETRKTAEQGDIRAQKKLALLYLKGKGVEKNEIEAMNWCRKAAEQGDAVAQTNLGWIYRVGKGVKKNDVEAVKWYRKAAEQGNAKAQNDLGVAYIDGKGIKMNETEGVRWLRMAAEQGHAAAQDNLGEIYHYGVCGVEENYEEAAKWYQKAAEQGNEDAIRGLEEMKKKINLHPND